MGLVSLRLGRYRQQIEEHLNTSINPDRPLRALLLVAALYHDTGKPGTFRRTEDGRIRFLEHEALSAKLARRRAKAWRLNNPEIERLETIVRHHMRPLLLAQAAEPPSLRAIYRFFRDTGPAGVDICLLSLADTLATYGATLPQTIWSKQLDTVHILLEAWWEQPQESVHPPALLNGHDLMQIFHLAPGPQIGHLLEEIREAQAAGELKSRDAALQSGAAPNCNSFITGRLKQEWMLWIDFIQHRLIIAAATETMRTASDRQTRRLVFRISSFCLATSRAAITRNRNAHIKDTWVFLQAFESNRSI